MYCNKCGKPINGDGKLCENCIDELLRKENKKEERPVPVVTGPIKGEKMAKSTLILSLVLLGMVIVSVIGIAIIGEFIAIYGMNSVPVVVVSWVYLIVMVLLFGASIADIVLCIKCIMCFVRAKSNKEPSRVYILVFGIVCTEIAFAEIIMYFMFLIFAIMLLCGGVTVVA